MKAKFGKWFEKQASEPRSGNSKLRESLTGSLDGGLRLRVLKRKRGFHKRTGKGKRVAGKRSRGDFAGDEWTETCR
ncbi:unnamed protein product [Arabidopsis thaliana]|uniref:Uncharacterized protein n=1 Tax=Arabidopsis thaliana TaxID=3702 RepID=A0A5S9XHM6_ARATH|nr:unnamed protein product [Arabidopsis thaliana]